MPSFGPDTATTPPHGQPRGRPFTLLELIMVMAMVALLLSITAPQLRGFHRGRALVETSRQCLALTRYAASAAVSRSDIVEFWIDAGDGRYGVRSLLGRNSAAPGPERSYELPAGLAFEVDSGATAAAAEFVLTWLPDGTFESGTADPQFAVRDLAAANRAFLIRPDPEGTRFVIASEGDDE